jgi:Transposase DDE domain
MNDRNQLVFDEIVAPILPLIHEETQKQPRDATTYTLSFQPFTLNLLFALINGIKSISLLVTETKTSTQAKTLGLVIASNSMYSEAFHRYRAQTYRTLLYLLLEKMNFLKIPEIQALGRFCCVDGSVFPAIITMTWAAYQQKRNAIKLHLAFELNRMIPTQFLSTEANASERKMLRRMLEAGVPYIADRGYVCFELFHDINYAKAHFIIRATSHLLYDIYETFSVEMPEHWSTFFTDVQDRKIRLTNDAHQHDYRLVSFVAMGEYFSLITDRFDLRTSEIIMLYAYRWQVELIFRFLKRTMHGLHLMCHHPSGVETQFTLYMISYLLLLHFKQKCAPVEIKKLDEVAPESYHEQNDESASESWKGTPSPSMFYVCGLVSLLGDRVRQYWKMGIHWLTTVRNSLLLPFTPDISRLIWSMQ